MADLIARQAAVDVLHGYFDGMLETDTWSPCDVYGLIEILPSVQPEQCEWIPKEASNVPYGLIVECSKCKHSELIDNALYHKYCPNCGRKVIRKYE